MHKRGHKGKQKEDRAERLFETKLHEKTVRKHIYIALFLVVVMFGGSMIFVAFRELLHKGIELTLAALIYFLLFGVLEG